MCRSIYNRADKIFQCTTQEIAGGPSRNTIAAELIMVQDPDIRMV